MLWFWSSYVNATTHEITAEDQIINCSIVSVLILCSLCRQSSTHLYFTTTTFQVGRESRLSSCPAWRYQTFWPTWSQCDHVVDRHTTHLHIHHDDTKTGLFQSGLFYMFLLCNGMFSQCTTTLSAITRFLKIQYPFKRLKKRTLKVYLAVYTFTMIVCDVIAVPILSHKIYHSATDSDETKHSLWIASITITGISVVLNCVHCILRVVISMASLIYVYLQIRQSEFVE